MYDVRYIHPLLSILYYRYSHVRLLSHCKINYDDLGIHAYNIYIYNMIYLCLLLYVLLLLYVRIGKNSHPNRVRVFIDI